MTTINETIRAIELADHHAHTTSAPRGRWMLPLLQGFYQRRGGAGPARR